MAKRYLTLIRLYPHGHFRASVSEASLSFLDFTVSAWACVSLAMYYLGKATSYNKQPLDLISFTQLMLLLLLILELVLLVCHSLGQEFLT